METIIGTIIQMYSCISELFVVCYVICESRDLCNSKTNPLNDKHYVWYIHITNSQARYL